MKLKQPVFIQMPVKEIKPKGWLFNQLKIQAKGLSGNLDKIWPDIKDSMWIGGDKEGWERVPYWLDGFIPLAWLIEDEDMQIRAKKYIDYIIEHQVEDGWICPGDKEGRDNYDVWALFLILKVLVLYHDVTADQRIEGVVQKALKSLDRHIDHNVLFSWAQTRWFECLISIWWLYERTSEDWLIALASKLYCQGFNWIDFFKYWPYKAPDERGRWSQMSHVVNNAMALKSGALYSRMTGNEEQLHSAENMVKLLDEYHGMVTGVFSGDECLAGKSPIQGTELCAVAEYMYSLEHLISLTGKAQWGDRLERITYNALPATFSPDMWTHQYDQQVNQVECSIREQTVFGTNGGDANLFGLEPNFGCCTANLSQPWPKFAMNNVMRSETGFAVVSYAPTAIDTYYGNTRVQISIETDYPFNDTINISVITDEPVHFTFELRIPSWCENAAIIMNGKKDIIVGKEYFRLEREWERETIFTIQLPMIPKLEPRPNDLFAVVRGPLVYSLAIEERWVRVNQEIEGREYPHCDYEIYAKSPWNYGLRMDRDCVEEGIRFEQGIVGDMPFSPVGAPIKAKVKGIKIQWPMDHGSAIPQPSMKGISNLIEELSLLPYGCTNLRLTEMPLI